MSDPASRIYVGQGFVVRPALENAINHIKKILKVHPQMIALLEFTSQGEHHRQIDVALVGPGGVDLIEIKNKHGVVEGSPEGPWTVTRNGGKEYIVNRKSGVEENPFQQARNTADDLKGYLQDVTNHRIWVCPMVWLPSASPDSQIVGDSFVGHVVGLQEFAESLRSATRRKDAWGGFRYQELPKHFHLKPINMAFLRGCVVEPMNHDGVVGLTILINVAGTQRQIQTDQHGQFDFAVDKGAVIELTIVVPNKYQQPAVLKLKVDQDYGEIDRIVLAECPPTKTEEEIYLEVKEKLQEEMAHRIEKQMQASQRQQGQMGFMIDDLKYQLQQALQRLDEQLSQKSEPQSQVLSLPVQVEQLRIQQYRDERSWQIEQAITHLEEAQPEKKVIESSLELLIEVLASERIRNDRADRQIPMIPVKTVVLEPRLPMESSIPEEEPVDAAFIPDTEVETTRSSTQKFNGLWWLGIFFAMIIVGWLWQERLAKAPIPQQQTTNIEKQEVTPAPVLEEGQTLPGKALDETSDHEMPLPGVPVHSADDP